MYWHLASAEKIFIGWQINFPRRYYVEKVGTTKTVHRTLWSALRKLEGCSRSKDYICQIKVLILRSFNTIVRIRPG